MQIKLFPDHVPTSQANQAAEMPSTVLPSGEQHAHAPASKASVSDTSPIEMLSARILVPEAMQEGFDKTLAKLNRKAANFGLPEITVLTQKTELYVRETMADGEYIHSKTRRFDPKNDPLKFPPLPTVIISEIDISYPIIQKNGWEIVGKLEAIQGSNLSYTYKHEDRNAVKATMDYSDCPINCEHCNIKQKRKESFILQNKESGEFKQVGTSCLEDFTGIDPAKALFLHKAFESFKVYNGDYDPEDNSALRKATSFALKTYIAAVSFLTEESGFVSRKTANEKLLLSTSDEAANMLLDGGKTDPKLWKKFCERYDFHAAQSDAISSWVSAKEMGSYDQFLSNLKRIFTQTDIKIFDSKQSAFAAAAVPMYLRDHAAKLEKSAQPASVHVGSPGDKISTALKIHGLKQFHNSFGLTTIVQLKDKDFNNIVWKTSACPDAIKSGQGKCIEATFKVKGHTQFRDENQTEITHLKVSAWLEHDIHLASAAVESPDGPTAQKTDAGAIYTPVREKNPTELAVAMAIKSEDMPLLRVAIGIEESLSRKWPGFPRRSAKISALENLENKAMHCLESGDQSDFTVFRTNTGMDCPEFLSKQDAIANLLTEIDKVPVLAREQTSPPKDNEIKQERNR